jgi:hypothetical protein
MSDDLDTSLNASAPTAHRSTAVGDELTALEYSTERQVRRRRHLLWTRVGIPALIGAIALGGTGAALTSPVVQQTLGIPQPQPSATIALPTSGCTATTYLIGNVGPTPVSVRRTETLTFATSYLSKVDIRKIERSETFRSSYGPYRGTLPEPPLGTNGVNNQVESERWQKEELRRLDAQDEWNALGIAIYPGLRDAVVAKGLDSSIVGWDGDAVKCPGGSH